MRSFCIHFLSPRPRVDKWVTVRAETGERRRKTAGVEHRAMHLKNKPLSDPNCSPRVSHSWANLYVPAPLVSGQRETGSDRPPIARPVGRRWPQDLALTAVTNASRQTAYVWLMEANCSLWKRHRPSTTKNTSEATFSAGWQWRGRRQRRGRKALKWKRWKGERRGWLNAVRLSQATLAWWCNLQFNL